MVKLNNLKFDLIGMFWWCKVPESSILTLFIPQSAYNRLTFSIKKFLTRFFGICNKEKICE